MGDYLCAYSYKIEILMRIITTFLSAVILSTSAWATEGMWLPYMLMDRHADMSALGLQLSAEDIYSVNNGSLKDAIVSFGGFCTGEIISDKGLVLTNHHCGYGAIQSHSSVENDYLKHGYWAMSSEMELPNEGLFVRFVKYIEDVTDPMMVGIDESMTEDEKNAQWAKNADDLITDRKSKEDFEYQVKPIFYGNQFILIASVRYTDVRLVGAPPSSIGKYGADTDNWVWPRHTGDFSLFRIYAAPDNSPADYAEENVPFKPYRSLTVSLKGTSAGDFTMVYGFPGRTEEYLPAVAVEQMVDQLNPLKIDIREQILSTMDSYMRVDDAIRIQYASKYASTANAWKKWIGQVQGLDRTHGTDSIRRAEARIQYRLSEDNVLWQQYGQILPELEGTYREALPYFEKRDRFIEIVYRGMESARFLWGIRDWLEAAQRGDTAAVLSGADRVASRLTGFSKDYSTTVDSAVTYNLLHHWVLTTTASERPAFLEARFADGDMGWNINVASFFPNNWPLRKQQMETTLANLSDDPYAVATTLSESPLYGFVSESFNSYLTEVAPVLGVYEETMESLQRDYMRAQMVVGDQANIYPDANSTMRITYGQVEGYKPADGVEYKTHTYLDGVIAKYVPGDYEFDLPERVLELYQNKEYGQYAADNGQLPVCFIASNHTSGGNSGSPALNAKGELIGLNFDRVWEGTMSDVYFDPSICRNIMVDIRYVLWVVDIYAGAGHLVEEMNIVTE